MLTKLKMMLRLGKSNQPRSVSVITPKPEHVAIIMDGNGRWANAQGMSRVAGHKRGVDSVKALIKSCIHHEIRYLSIFAFSSENWSRPQAEIDALMELLANALETQTRKLDENGVRLRLIGDLSRFSEKIRDLADQAQQRTAKNSTLVFNIAVNYGGRWDITQACRKLAAQVADGQLSPQDITEASISRELSTAGIPDPDLFIRTSGEYRISNFLLWQAAYSEFYFTDVLWPDFDEAAFTDALLKYTQRERRFGNAIDNVDRAADMSVVGDNSDESPEATTKHA